MPSSRQARMTRMAISPRLAIKTFLNMRSPRLKSALLHFEQLLPKFHARAILYEHLEHSAGDIALYLIHEFHGFDDAQRLPDGNGLTYVGEDLGIGRR